MARTSRTARIVVEDRASATGLTVDGAIGSYHLSLSGRPDMSALLDC